MSFLHRKNILTLGKVSYVLDTVFLKVSYVLDTVFSKLGFSGTFVTGPTEFCFYAFGLFPIPSGPCEVPGFVSTETLTSTGVVHLSFPIGMPHSILCPLGLL